MAAKKRKSPEPFFSSLVEVWFNFCREKFDESPTFDGSAPRDLKSIIIALRERAEKSGLEWTENVATTRLHNFLLYAWQDYWLSKNWLLSNISRQKEKIFYSIRAAVKKQESNTPFN
jgi:hypothetical protein